MHRLMAKLFCVRMFSDGKGDLICLINFVFEFFFRHEGFLLRYFLFCYRVESFFSDAYFAFTCLGTFFFCQNYLCSF